MLIKIWTKKQKEMLSFRFWSKYKWKHRKIKCIYLDVDQNINGEISTEKTNCFVYMLIKYKYSENSDNLPNKSMKSSTPIENTNNSKKIDRTNRPNELGLIAPPPVQACLRKTKLERETYLNRPAMPLQDEHPGVQKITGWSW